MVREGGGGGNGKITLKMVDTRISNATSFHCYCCFLCPVVPDLHVEGTLQAIHVMLDKSQLELIKGLVEMNLGETIEEFEKPSTVIRDPVAQVRGEGWEGRAGGERGRVSHVFPLP